MPKNATKPMSTLFLDIFIKETLTQISFVICNN